MTKRFTSQNLQWEARCGIFIHEECQPAQSMHSYQKVTVFSPTDRFTFFAERKILVWNALKTLTGHSLPNEVFLLPAGLLEAKATFPANFEVSDQEISLFAAVPAVVGTGSQLFALGSHNASCIAVLTARGIFVLRRDQGMTASDAFTTLNHHIGFRCTHLVGMLGEKHQEETLCPKAADNLQVLDYVKPKVQDGIISFTSSHEALKEFADFLQDTGLQKMLPALGVGIPRRCRKLHSSKDREDSDDAEAISTCAVYEQCSVSQSTFFFARSKPGTVQDRTHPPGAASSSGMFGCGMLWQERISQWLTLVKSGIPFVRCLTLTSRGVL